MVSEYVHCLPDTKIESISGHYVLQNEKRIAYKGKDILVVFGYGVVETSCCGAGGGARFANVPGFVVNWHSNNTPGGDAISIVEPVTDESDMEAITELINELEVFCQVNFA